MYSKKFASLTCSKIISRFWWMNKLQWMMNKLQKTNETNDAITRERLLCRGYIRQIESIYSQHKHSHDILYINNIMPIGIVTIIHLFSLMFQWNRDNNAHGKGIRIINDRTIIHYPQNNLETHAIFTACNIISSDYGYKKIKFEIMVQKTKEKIADIISCRFGFVKYPISKSINGIFNKYNLCHSPGTKNQFAVKFTTFPGKSGYVTVYSGNYNGSKDIHFKSMNHSYEDKYMLIFDVIEKNVTFYYNSKFVAVVNDQLWDKVVPAASFWTVSNLKQKIVCSQWEIVQ
eukprot:15592_1